MTIGFFLILSRKFPETAFLVKNTQIRHFWSQISAFLLLPKIFTIRQIRRFWFWMWKICFKILAQKYPNKAFLVGNLDISVFSRKFAIKQIRGCWFQLWEKFFQISSQKYIHQAFLGQNLSIFFPSHHFAVTLIRRNWFEIWQ